MFKKLVLVGAVVLVGAWAWGSGVGREAMSYVQTGWKEFRNCTKDCVPIDFELKRAENMLNNLDRTDDKLISALAGQIQTLKRMEGQIEVAQANVDDLRHELKARNDELKTMLVKGNTGYDREQRALALETKFKGFKAMEAKLKALSENRDQTQARLSYIKEQRESLKGQRVELANRIATLKTNLELLKLSETRSKSAVGDDQLAELADLKKLVDGLEERIGTSLIEHQLRTEGTKEAPAPKNSVRPASTTITAEIDSFFGQAPVAAENK